MCIFQTYLVWHGENEATQSYGMPQMVRLTEEDLISETPQWGLNQIDFMRPIKIDRASEILHALANKKRIIEKNKMNYKDREYYKEMAKVTNRENLVNAILLIQLKNR